MSVASPIPQDARKPIEVCCRVPLLKLVDMYVAVETCASVSSTRIKWGRSLPKKGESNDNAHADRGKSEMTFRFLSASLFCSLREGDTAPAGARRTPRGWPHSRIPSHGARELFSLLVYTSENSSRLAEGFSPSVVSEPACLLLFFVRSYSLDRSCPLAHSCLIFSFFLGFLCFSRLSLVFQFFFAFFTGFFRFSLRFHRYLFFTFLFPTSSSVHFFPSRFSLLFLFSSVTF